MKTPFPRKKESEFENESHISRKKKALFLSKREKRETQFEEDDEIENDYYIKHKNKSTSKRPK